MKVYLFDTINGLFEGETFEEPDIIRYEEGMTAISPPAYEHGQVPVFDHRRNGWTVIPISVAKQLLDSNMTESTENKS